MPTEISKFKGFESAIPLDVERRASMWNKLRIGRQIDFGDYEDAKQALGSTMLRLAVARPNIFTTAVRFTDVSGEVYVLTGEVQHDERIAKLTAYLGALSSDDPVMKYYVGEIGGPNDLTNETVAWVSPGHDLAWSFHYDGVADVADDARLPQPRP